MNNEAKRRLQHALDACYLINQFVSGRTLEDYESDEMLRAAVERKFEIIGEALNQAEIADETVSDDIPDLRQIVGLRNRIIHGYEVIDNELIWRVTEVNLPRLTQQLESLLGKSSL